MGKLKSTDAFQREFFRRFVSIALHQKLKWVICGVLEA